MAHTNHKMLAQTSESHWSTLDLFRLLQLASSNLPVGGYTFSQGLEYAIEKGWLIDESDVALWIEQVSVATLQFSDLPLIKRQFECIEQVDWGRSEYWNTFALAIRETIELQLSDKAMGEALLRLAKGMNIDLPEYCFKKEPLSFISLYSLVSASMNLALADVCAAYAWTVIENQVMAATKLLPLGQTSAQLMLFELSEKIREVVDQSFLVPDSEIGLSLPGLAMASAHHEIQYTRLYRS